MHGHAATDAVSEHHEALDPQMFQHAGEAMRGFIFDESWRGWGSQAVGAAEAQPVIGDHCSTGCLGEGGWEVFPLFDTAERLVQQQDRGVVRAQRVAPGNQLRTNIRPWLPSIHRSVGPSPSRVLMVMALSWSGAEGIAVLFFT